MTDTRSVMIRCHPADLLAEETRERSAATRAGEYLSLVRYERDGDMVCATLIFRKRSEE